MPFELMNAPATCQEMMHMIVKYEEVCVSYVNDILIEAGETQAEH